MHIERVQRWVMSAVLLTVAYVWAVGLVLGALYTVEESRDDAQVGLLVMAGVIGVAAMTGVRLISQLRLITPWLLTALVAPVVGAAVLMQR